PVAPLDQVTVAVQPTGSLAVTARLLKVPAIAGARAGLALDASESMKERYGIQVKTFPPPKTPPVNLMEPQARTMARHLTDCAADRRVCLLYWACGLQGSRPEEQIEPAGLLSAAQADAIPVKGPAKRRWGKATNLLPPLRYFVEDAFRDAPWAV